MGGKKSILSILCLIFLLGEQTNVSLVERSPFIICIYDYLVMIYDYLAHAGQQVLSK